MRLAYVLVAACAAEPAPPAPVSTPSFALLTRDTPDAPLAVAPPRVRWGAPLWPRLDGLAPGAQVTLTSFTPGLSATATYTAGDDGIVDVTTSSADAGSYTGVEPDGLVWAATADPTAKGTDHDLEIVASVDGAVLSRARLQRDFLADGVTMTPITSDGLDGQLFVPADPGPHPALVAFGGSEGGIDGGVTYASYWAGRGYVVLAIAYFGAANVPADLSMIPVEYFGKAVAFVQARPDVDPARVGVIGGSRGGEAALLVGSKVSGLAAVVAEVPSGVAWSDGTGASSWSANGAGVPYIPDRGAPTTLPGNVLSYRAMFVQSLAAASPAERTAATFAVENAPPILMIAGDDDQLFASCVLAQVALDRLHAAGRDDELDCYPDAGHWMGVPGSPTFGMDKTYHPILMQELAIGGTPAGIAHAQRASTDREIAFLREHLGGL